MSAVSVPVPQCCSDSLNPAPFYRDLPQGIPLLRLCLLLAEFCVGLGLTRFLRLTNASQMSEYESNTN
jgi:hypothetical protein